MILMAWPPSLIISHLVAGANRPPENAPNREQKVELFVSDLQKVLRIELNGGVAGEVEDAFDEAAVLSEHLEGEAAALEVVEDAGVVAADVHPAAERREVDVHRRLLRVAAENYRVGLHVVLEILALQLRETCLHVAAAHFPELGFRSSQIDLGEIDGRERLAW